MNAIIDAESIVKSYGQGKERRNVLDGVSVEIGAGEFVAIMGPSGCGKSSLLFAMSGMDEIDSGQVRFDGKGLSDLREDELADIRRTRMGFVFQQPTMLKNLNIIDNIILPSMHGRSPDRAAIIRKARELMRKAGIADLERRTITQVSGGQLQRAGICRALMSEPRIIFGDEPTGALNSKASHEVMNMLAEINDGGTAILVVTHDAKVAARAERVLFMCDGRIANEIRYSRDAADSFDERNKRISGIMNEIGV